MCSFFICHFITLEFAFDFLQNNDFTVGTAGQGLKGDGRAGQGTVVSPSPIGLFGQILRRKKFRRKEFVLVRAT